MTILATPGAPLAENNSSQPAGEVNRRKWRDSPDTNIDVIDHNHKSCPDQQQGFLQNEHDRDVRFVFRG